MLVFLEDTSLLASRVQQSKLAALGMLAQQILVQAQGNAAWTDYTTAGMLGVVLFIVPLAIMPISGRLRESEALVRRQEVDLANLAQLSQYIVQHLRESILVVDTQDRIRLIAKNLLDLGTLSADDLEILLAGGLPRCTRVVLMSLP